MKNICILYIIYEKNIYLYDQCMNLGLKIDSVSVKYNFKLDVYP